MSYKSIENKIVLVKKFLKNISEKSINDESLNKVYKDFIKEIIYTKYRKTTTVKVEFFIKSPEKAS